MASEIKTWQIVDGNLIDISTTLAKEGRTEPEHLEKWILTNPSILGHDLLVIGRQVSTESGPIDILAIDNNGDLVVIELKRGRLPREALAQAIDYAACVANWSVERLSEQCTKYLSTTLEEAFAERFSDVELENVNVNETQRLILAGCSIDASLERMIDWLSNAYGVSINAIILSYVKTQSGEELLTKTAMISEEVQQIRTKSKKKFQIAMSDAPGDYDETTLKQKLVRYFSRNILSAQRMREVLVPACLRQETVTRQQLLDEFVAVYPDTDPSKTGYFASLISSQMGMEKRDFLRQVISYDYPRYKWEKDNYKLNEKYRSLVEEVLEEVNQNQTVES